MGATTLTQTEQYQAEMEARPRVKGASSNYLRPDWYEYQTVDGLIASGRIEVNGEVFEWKANGPSFFNGLGNFELWRVNGGKRFYGSIEKDGHLSVSGSTSDIFAYVAARPSEFAALGQMAADDEFLAVAAAVAKFCAERGEKHDGSNGAMGG